jgi:hypothetical protein
MLYGVTPIDPVSFAGAGGLLILLALLAAYVPSRRAAWLSPVETLRCGDVPVRPPSQPNEASTSVRKRRASLPRKIFPSVPTDDSIQTILPSRTKIGHGNGVAFTLLGERSERIVGKREVEIC